MATPFQRPSPWGADSYPSADSAMAGKAVSATFVSCMQSTSGWA